MNRPDLSTNLLGRVLQKTGGLFPILVVIAAQLSTNLLALPGAYFIQLNAELSARQLNQAALFTLATLLTGNVFLWIYIYLTNRQAERRLVAWHKGKPLSTGTNEEHVAWRQITSLPWRYTVASVLVSIFLDILPLMAYQRFSLKATNDQVIYTLMGGVISASVMIAFAVLFMDRWLAPARVVLLPAEFENQLSGSAGARMRTKFQVITFILGIVSILMIAPIGYHGIVTVLIGGIIGTQGAIHSLQTQTIIAGCIAMVLGSALSYILSRSVADPIRQMISVFDKVEKGDLKQRAIVNATDEVSELSFHFNRMIARLDELQSTLEKTVAERTAQLKATTEVSSVASTILNPDELITKVVNLITDRFGYYYTAIFLLDEANQMAVLKDATGTAGQTLKASGHKLPLGGKSMVSTAVATRRARIALDVGMEPARFDNPLLPNTRSEIALPMIIGDRIIGVLDVQSTEEAAFGEEDVETLQGMVNNVTTAIENARLFQETQKSLDELRNVQRTYLTNAWSEASRNSEGYEYNSTVEAPQTGLDVSNIDVPITLREQIIGQLHLEGQQEWTAEERSMVEAVATQAALAMENARLLEESRQMALRERLAAEITGKVWSSPNTDYILQTALKELSRALHADEATIELKMD